MLKKKTKNHFPRWRLYLSLSMRLLPVVLFLGWYIRLCFFEGKIPFIPDSFSLPYNLESFGYGEIFWYYDRQPPGYQLYAKLITDIVSGSTLSTYEMISLLNAAAFVIMLLCLYSLFDRYASRWVACGLTSFMALGLEFHIYVLFVRYSISTAFWVLILIYFHARAFSPRFRGIREPWMAAALWAALFLLLTRSFYVYFLFLYVPLWGIAVWGHYRKNPLQKKRFLPVALSGVLVVGLPLFLMIKNNTLYGHFSLSSWAYDSQQTNVFRQIKAGRVKCDVANFIQESDSLSDATKALYAAGLKWPTSLHWIRHMLDDPQSKIYKLVHNRFPPIPGIPQKQGDRPHLYYHTKSWNGYPFGRLLREGTSVARAVFKAHWDTMLYDFFKYGTPRALCYSTFFFSESYGSPFCDRAHGIAELWQAPLPNGLKKQRGYLKVVSRYFRLHQQMVPQVFYSMHLLLHQLLMPWIMVLGGCVLLGSAVRVLTRRQVDSSIVLTAMVMVYSYLIGIVGDYYEGARYGVYWKLPTVFLAAWSVTAGVRIIQRVTPRLRESLRVRGRAFTGKWGKWRDKWRRTKADSTT